MQLKSLRLSCSTRSLMEPSTTLTLFNWRSFTGSRVAMPPGLASANRRSSCAAVEMAWPGGSCLNDKGQGVMESFRIKLKKTRKIKNDSVNWSDMKTVKD